MKILVVDDSSTMRRIIKNTLVRLGHQYIKEAEDGIQALEIFKSFDFDIIITDWNMPNMNGLDLVKTIRGSERGKDIPIIMVTTEGGKGEVITALKAGVNNYIVKPFTPQILKDKLSAIIF